MASVKQHRTIARRRTRRVLNRAGDLIKSVGRAVHRSHWGRGMGRGDI